ncbi:nucleotide-diphospho-sugar transferase [Hymenobacter sp. 15J16-1T3B]|uniref:nucleotide-diphospho-sugar transferase n=1 Tax=Hymenobacter sp. 15J16-1T3B TaxID=2886941 RepID=UPI001D122C15|nr:nucleotide-diphospho-sugar transferase [Hymenobacter sp. 15J16-1T3B]MCC3158527.1 nucleotide-diphospho-sugar transferase [Hymenobacter sp. 15J16-1T3B]
MTATPTAPFPTSVLLLVFNRPEPTRRVLDALREVRPARLYVAADGPRPHRPADAALCQQVRELVRAAVDWPCELHTLYQDVNLNCGVGPATAISWFFGHESEGIILEDDCVPAPEFFPFCQELLARYRHDTRVMHIGGNNFAREAARPLPAGADSYYFSGQVNSWGWATWRRAWHLFDFHLRLWPELARRGQLQQLYPSALERRYWLPKFAALHAAPAPPDIWDYQWHFAVAAHSGLCIVPAVNLVRNIGFGADATHTFDAGDAHADVPTAALPWPLRHPPAVLRDRARDRRRFRAFMLERVAAQVQRLLRRLLPGAEQPALPAPPAVAPLPPAAAPQLTSSAIQLARS